MKKLATRHAPALLLAAHLVLLLHGAWHDSVTFDEPIFVGGGVASWQGGHHVYPSGGALPQRLEGLPLVLSGVRVPTDDPRWPLGDGFGIGGAALFRSGHDPRWLTFLARLPVALACTALAWGMFAVARGLLGQGCATVALALYAFSPAFLAHGRLATADLLATLTLFAATWLAHRCLQRLTWLSLLLSCAATAAAFLAKFSAILLPLMVAAVVVARFAAGAPLVIEGRARRIVSRRTSWALAVGGIVAAHAAATILALWLAHDFRWSASREGFPLGPTEGGWEVVEDVGPTAPAVAFAREHRLLPEAWLYGLQYTVQHAEERRAYAASRYSLTGWWWYFPFVVALKTPFAALALFALGSFAFMRAWRRGTRLTTDSNVVPPVAAWARAPAGADVLELAPLAALFVVYWATALTSNLNIGLRHVLPSFPVAFVVAGAAWRLAELGARWRVAASILVGVAVAAGLLAHPNHLGWMNFAGGPEASRWRRLVDSSLDWGQGLREAAAVVKEEARPGEIVHLCYFGTAEPAAEGMSVRGLAGLGDRWRAIDGLEPGAGLYVVSATQLVQLWSRACPGPWRPEYEAAWRASRDRMAPWRDASPEGRAALLHGPEGDTWRAWLREHDELIAGRICAALRHRQPLRVIGGGAMLCYRLDADEALEALLGPPVELVTDPAPFARPASPSPAARTGRSTPRCTSGSSARRSDQSRLR